MKLEKHIDVGQGESVRLIDMLAAQTDLSKTLLKECMNKGGVWLKREGRKERRVRRAKLDLLPGDRVSIYYDQNILSQEVVQPRCLADQKEYSVWDKPAGMLSQGTRFGDHCSLLRFAEKQTKRFTPHLVHRLDREARGLVLIAHSKKSAALFSELFRTRRVIKRYHAKVEGVFNPEDRTFEINTPLDGKSAHTVCKVIEEYRQPDSSLLDIEIHTGRYHQIRRHLREIGHPLLGDRRYNALPGEGLLFLEAYELEFVCPFMHKKVSYRIPSL